MKRYSVWLNRNDLLVCCDGDYKQCSKAMGIDYHNFYHIKLATDRGKQKKWTILECTDDLDE